MRIAGATFVRPLNSIPFDLFANQVTPLAVPFFWAPINSGVNLQWEQASDSVLD